MPGREHVSGGSKKDQRMYEHIKASSSKKGRSSATAKRIAAATVNKKRRAEGRTKKSKSKKH
jgi:hypothetical protein